MLAEASFVNPIGDEPGHSKSELSPPPGALPSPPQTFSANRAIDDGGDRQFTRPSTHTIENTAQLCRQKTAARLPFLEHDL
jgi:hypothetical protein